MWKEALAADAFEDDETARNLPPEQKAVWNEMFACRAEIEEILHKNASIGAHGQWGFETNITVASYLLAKAGDFSNPFSVHFEDLKEQGIDEDIYEYALSAHIDEVWNELLQLLKEHPINIFILNAVLKYKTSDYSDATPDGVADLAAKLLDIQPDENVAELCCGTGSVISAIKEANPTVEATGYEISLSDIAAAKANAAFDVKKVAFVRCDVFDLFDSESDTPVFDKIFANYPFGMRLRELSAGKRYLDVLAKRIPSVSKATSSDWLYNMLMTEMLSEKGKAIGIMTNGSTWNMIDAPIREFFVENGLVECVIALPARLFGIISIPTSLIVLSRGNTGVRLVDASSVFTPGRRVNDLNEDNVSEIIGLLSADSDKSIFVEKERLRENDYVLNTSRYLAESMTVDDGVPFGTVITRITRGAPLNAGELDKIASAVPTDMQYLLLSNIQNGIIDDDLPYLTVIDRKHEKYCLTDRCLILSKNGYPYKVAVAEVGKHRKIMANGNLYLIELDGEKVNPYYLAAFFSSRNGIAALKSITVGATVPNIGVDQLKKLIIPLPDMEKQNETAACYLEARDEILTYQRKLAEARDRMSHVFEDSMQARPDIVPAEKEREK